MVSKASWGLLDSTHARGPLAFDLEESDGDPDRILMGPDRGLVDDTLQHLDPPERMLPVVGRGRAACRDWVAQVEARSSLATLPEFTDSGTRC